MTARKDIRQTQRYEFRPIVLGHFVLALFALALVHLVGFTFWMWLVEFHGEVFGGAVRPFVAGLVSSSAAFIAVVHSRPASQRDKALAFLASLVCAAAASLGVALAGISANALFPAYSDNVLAWSFTGFVGLWSAMPVMYIAALRLGLRRVGEEDGADEEDDR